MQQLACKAKLQQCMLSACSRAASGSNSCLNCAAVLFDAEQYFLPLCTTVACCWQLSEAYGTCITTGIHFISAMPTMVWRISYLVTFIHSFVLSLTSYHPLAYAMRYVIYL